MSEAPELVMRTRAAWGEALWRAWCQRYMQTVPPGLIGSKSFARVVAGMEQGAPMYIADRDYFNLEEACSWLNGRQAFAYVTKTRERSVVDDEIKLISEVIMGDDVDDSWEELATNVDALTKLTFDLLPDGIPNVSLGDWEALWKHVARYETA